VAEIEQLGEEDRAREALVLGLRRLEGVERAAFLARFGFRVDDLGGDDLHRFVNEGLIDDDGRRIRLTRRGLLVSDALWPALVRV
jgi:oxygen-independent coproporphyrinogen-3 oxidase